MKAKQLYLYLFSLVACLVCSCSSDTPDTPEADNAGEIVFAVGESSRGGATSLPASFAIYGSKKFNNSPLIPVFDKTIVTYDNGSWTYNNPQYWFPDHEYSFVAVAPTSVVETTPPPAYSDSQLTFTYAIPTKGNNTVIKTEDIPDILAATYRCMYQQDYTNNTVVFYMMHLMSKINLTAVLVDNLLGKDDYIKFHKIELADVVTQATFRLLPAELQSANQTADCLFDITGHTANNNLTFEFASGVKVFNDQQGVSLFDDGSPVIMIPQNLADGGNAGICLYFSVNEETDILEATLPLTGLRWESGKSYNYRFTIDRRGVALDKCDIIPWEPVAAGDISVD